MNKQIIMTTKKTSSSKAATASKSTTASKKAPAKKAPSRKKIDEELIRERAREIYLRRMEQGTPGDADSDWLQAEQELRNS